MKTTKDYDAAIKAAAYGVKVVQRAVDMIKSQQQVIRKLLAENAELRRQGGQP